jgi:hypothetical protein
MKKIQLLIGLLLLVSAVTAQVPNMRTKLVYNPLDCRYEVYATPSNSASSFNMGGSQIVIAVPHNMIANYNPRRSAFVITTVAPITNSWVITAWADTDLIQSYAGSFDYYAVDNNGGPLGSLVANQDILLFHFKLGNNCFDGIRLWEGTGATPNIYNDPKYPSGGGDFQTNIAEVSTLPIVETWVGNSTNVPTVLPGVSAAITTQDGFPAPGLMTIAVTPSGGAACSGYQYQWSGSGVWLVPPGNNSSGIVSSPGLGTYTVTVIDNNGCDEVASITLPLLPVELIKFTVTKADNDAMIHWVTATEVNNNYFDVEHSTNGEDFVQIGRVNSKNSNSTSVQNYDFKHTKTAKGINYYRLKQVDFDGTFEYSDIRSVVFGGPAGLTIYPNPTSDVLNVQMPLGLDETAVVEIINAAGQVVRAVQNPKYDGKILSMNIADIAIGYYFVQIRTASDMFREQFVITK